MPLVSSKEILSQARKRKYGVPSLLAGNLELVIGPLMAAEERRSPLILPFNQEVTPQVPMELGIPLAVNAAQRASVPVAVILDHGKNLEDIVRAIHLGVSSVMFDGSCLPYEDNVRQTREVVRVAHAVGVCVEAELGGISGSSVDLEDSGPQSSFTDPELAADFVKRTGVDTLAISFGNAHGVYHGTPALDLDRVRSIHARIDIPLVMHGASGLPADEYPRIVESGISKVCYYTAMGIGAANELGDMLADAGRDTIVYHHLISRAIDYFRAHTTRLIDLLGCAGTAP
ncbi:MAG: ketose 1,6-bisphosphate aldolase [Anaerolineae bacterium]